MNETPQLKQARRARRLKECLAVLEWSQSDLARMTDRDEKQIRRWASGEYLIPDDLMAWLEEVTGFVEANPPPDMEAWYARFDAFVEKHPPPDNGRKAMTGDTNR